jgi:hypothetical protein
MPDHPQANASFDVAELLTGFVNALNKANDALQADNLKSTAPVIYAIPKMSVEVKLTVGYQSGKVTGWIKKTDSSSNQEVISSLALDLVAVPNPKYTGS